MPSIPSPTAHPFVGPAGTIGPGSGDLSRAVAADGAPTVADVSDTPDLAAWEADVVLADGGTVHIRPILPTDGPLLRAFHSRLSAESIYFRFFSPRPKLSDAEIDHFTHVDYHDRMAFVALLAGEIIGVARYDRYPGTDNAEVAFIVDDAHQGRGISTLLLEHLGAVARQKGMRRFSAQVLPDNRKMLGVFRSVGFKAKNEYADGIIDVLMDISPTPEAIAKMEERERRSESRSVARFLAPRSVAVIGASSDPRSLSQELFRNLISGGYDGVVYPVNPAVPAVASVRTYPSLADVPDEVDLAIVALPAAKVRAALEACAAKGVQAVVVMAAGFADTGPGGLALQRSLVEYARGHGMRLLGPGSMGLISTGLVGLFHALPSPVPVRVGRVAISSQSGPLGRAMLELAHRLGVGISTFVSLGMKADLSGNDLLQYWYDDPRTDVVLLYTESFGNPRKFARVARRVARRKPVVAVKARGIGDDLAVDALFRQAGVIRVEGVSQLLDVGRLLAGQPLPPGPRVAIITNARSPGVLALGALPGAGLQAASFGVDLRRELARQLPVGAQVDNPVDLTHHAVPADYATTLDAVLADDAVDAVVVVHAPPRVERADVEAVAEVVCERGASAAKPVLLVSLGRDPGPLGPSGRVPAFAFPEEAVAALGKVAAYSAWRRRPEGTVPEPVGVDRDAAAALVDHALEVRPDGTLLPLSVVSELLAAYGIPFAPCRAVTDVEQAVAAAAAVGYPVAVKAAGLERLARSESGGVALDVQSEAELRATYTRMRDHLGKGMVEAVVQRMVPAGVEVIVELEQDPIFGPVVGVGLGGAFAEEIGDRSARSLPLTDLDVADLIASSRAARALRRAGAATAALEDLVSRVARLVDDVPEIDVLRLNPVLVSAEGAWAVDVTAHVAPVPTPLDVPLRRL